MVRRSPSSRLPVAGVVFAPPVVDELTTRKVLTTEWVDGERLDKSGKEDVSILCSIAMNRWVESRPDRDVWCLPTPRWLNLRFFRCIASLAI